MTIELTTAEAAQAFADAVATVRASYEAYVEAGFTDSTLSVWRSACNVAEVAFITFAFADEGNVARIAVLSAIQHIADTPGFFDFNLKGESALAGDITYGFVEADLTAIIAAFALRYAEYGVLDDVS
jgi:hypothetical protein